MSHRKRNMKRNKHIINYWWRGDIEDELQWRFPTKEDAWAHVVGQIRKSVKAFESKESTHGKTIVDWDKLKSDLMESGSATQIYCQCNAWWDNWEYFIRKDD